MFDPCKETVSILYAMIFGADGACINIGIGSLLWAFAAFMGVVIVLQFFARKIWKQMTNPAPQSTEHQTGTVNDDAAKDRDDGPIRPSRL